MKKIEEEKEKHIQNIQNEKENLEKQINEYSKIIKKREEEEEKKKEIEKEKEKKGIFMSCIEISKEDVERQEREEKKEKEENEENEGKEEKEEKEEKDDDEWEELNDVESDEEEKEIDIEECIMDDYEIVENYVDDEMNKIKNS